MRSPKFRRRLATVSALVLTVLMVTNSPAQASSFVPLVGDGSSWAEPAIGQWSRDVHSQGINISYTGDGSAAGRQNYIKNQADFASSDIAFLTTPDPFGGGTETSSYAYSYIPIVAGGTAFMYNLVVAGKKVTNLRLSTATIAKIFTGGITDWSDPQITHDYGTALPKQKITVVTRSDGAGASYMFTRWLWRTDPSLWTSFCQHQGGGGSCGPTEFYPQFPGSVQRNGSDQVASYVSSPAFGQGSIGYDEYAFALASNIPVVKVLNKAGYYSLPTPSNVAIALQAAIIDENPASLTFLMQNLDNVYVNPDPRTYPVSSYAYLIIPRDSRVINGNNEGPPPRWSSDKGVALSTWTNYVLCGAQQKAGALGYSPLPMNLVTGGFLQVNHVPGHVATANPNSCNNPTKNLIADAPQPSPCDKLTAPINCVVVGGVAKAGGSTTGGSTTGGTTGGGTTAKNGAAATKINPETGQTEGVVLAGGDGSQALNAEPVSLPGSARDTNYAMGVLTTLFIITALLVPGLLGAYLRRRRPVGQP